MLSLVPTDPNSTVFVAPIIGTSSRGFPELNAGGSTGTTVTVAPAHVDQSKVASPMVQTGKRFDSDFHKDW